MTCAGCEARDRTIADLTEELGAWRGNAAHEASRGTDLIRMDRWRRAFAVSASPAVVLMTLCDRAGLTVSHRSLVIATRARGTAARDSEEVEDKLAMVWVCQLRKALRQKGLGPIETVRNLGYVVQGESARAIRAFVGEVEA